MTPIEKKSLSLNRDEFFMGEALREAHKSAQRGEVPIGAVIVAAGRIIGRGHNESIGRKDPTAHAEIMAIRKACLRSKNYRLPDAEIYVTVEPCAMCLGAIIQARLKRLVFGGPEPKAGAVQSIMNFPLEKTNHRMEIASGVLAQDCGRILENFFMAKRKRRLAK
jgi:tRNA(adenine34) deaminase